MVWKPSEKTPLTALACQALFERAAQRFGADAPAGLSRVVIGLRDVGEALTGDARVALVSATGSTRMGREVGPRVAQRFGRCLLELGGNNAMIVTPRPISNWRCAPSCSPPPARPASAAPARAG